MSEVKTLGILFSTFFCVPLLEITYVSVVLCALMFASGAVIENWNIAPEHEEVLFEVSVSRKSVIVCYTMSSLNI